jgi:rubrerythrin
MTMLLNAGEVLQIAQQMERNGGIYYSRAAESAETEEAARMLRELAIMERKHEKVFADMADALEEQECQALLYDPDDDGMHYMQAIAGGHVFDLNADPVGWLGGGRTTSEVLCKALELEKDAIIYYLGVKDSVPERLGAAWIDEIIREEMGHVTLLSDMLGALEDES